MYYPNTNYGELDWRSCTCVELGCQCTCLDGYCLAFFSAWFQEAETMEGLSGVAVAQPFLVCLLEAEDSSSRLITGSFAC